MSTTAHQLEQIPAIAELAQLDQWVISKYVPRRGKLDKPPFSPNLDADHKTPWMCSHSDPSHWASYDVARASLCGFLWMGFVFHESDPYSGIDLDGCCKPDRERIRTRDDIEEWALRIIDLVNSYTEISPSGKGVKIFARGTIAEMLAHSMGEHVGIEIYSKQRYFTVTGAHLAGTPTEICNAQGALNQLEREYRPAAPAPARPAAAKQISQALPRRASAGQRPLDQVRAQYNAEHAPDQLLLDYGAVQTSSKDFSCPFCEHSHTNTLFIYNGRIYSRSPGCKIPQKRGLDPFGLYVLIEHNNDPIEAAKELNPIEPTSSRWVDDRNEAERWAAQQAAEAYAPREPDTAQIARRAADAQRKRDARQAAAAPRMQAAAETIANVRARAAADETLRPSDLAVLEALLTRAGDSRDWCRPSKPRLVQLSGYSLGSVKRSLTTLKARGYFSSVGKGGSSDQTAIRTFLRGSFASQMIPMLDHESDSYHPLEACEGGASPQPASATAHMFFLAPPAPAADRLAVLSYVRSLAKEAAEPGWALRDYAELDQVALEQEAARLEQLLQAAPADVDEAPAELEPTGQLGAADGASFDPAWATPFTGKPYEGRPKDFRNREEHEQQAASAIKVRPDSAKQPAKQPTEQHLLEAPAAPSIAAGVISQIGESIAAALLAELQLLEDSPLLAVGRLQPCPPGPSDPRYREFVWRWRAAQQERRTAAQRAYFKRQALAFCDYAEPSEAVRRWLAFEPRPPTDSSPGQLQRPQAPGRPLDRPGARVRPPSQAQQALQLGFG